MSGRTVDGDCAGCGAEMTIRADRIMADNYCGRCHNDGTAAADESWKKAEEDGLV